MVSRALTPSAWRSLSDQDRLEMLAYQQAVNEKRQRLIVEVVEKMPDDLSMLAQALINAMD